MAWFVTAVHSDTDRDRNTASARSPGRMSLRLTGSTFVDVAIRGNSGTASDGDRAMTIAGDISRGVGLSGSGNRLALTQGLGRDLAIRMTAARIAGLDGRSSSTSTGVAVTHRTGLRIGMTRIDEATSVLGLVGRGALATGGASTLLGEFGWDGSLVGWALNGRALIGRTVARNVASSLLEFDGAIMTSGFALSAQHDLGRGLVTFGLASPLRADRARLGGALPTGFDIARGASTATAFASDIAARSREFDVELGYAMPFVGGRFELVGAQAFAAGNVAGRMSTAALVRLVMIR